MGVMLRNRKFHYRFRLGGKSYSGVLSAEPLPESATPRQIEAVVPDYVKSYLKGAIKDEQVYDDLLECQERANGNFWGKVRARLGDYTVSYKVMKPTKEAKTQKVIEPKEAASEQKSE